jgi:hypothetical protein
MRNNILKLRQGQWNFAIEGKDFEMFIDGKKMEFKYDHPLHLHRQSRLS